MTRAKVISAAASLVAAVWLSTALAQTPALPRFELDEATIADLQQRMQAGRASARSIAEQYIARIEAVDRSGPSLHSVIEVNPDALAIADQLDAERRAGRVRGPLHGIPILVKDNIATADKMMTTAGSLALAGVKPPARGGQTKNPYALDRNPSGSSSGSGAAVAANLAAAAIGTETDGSIVSPSTSSGLVGIKPTLGLVSRAGIVPIAHSQDTAGPMARTVADAAALLSAIAGADPADAATTARRGGEASGAADYSHALDANGLRGARIGVVRNKLFGYSAAADRIAEAAIADMKKLGAVIVDPANIPTLGKFGDSEFEVLLYEFKADLTRYLTALGPASPVHSLADVIAFNDAHAREEMPYFGQEIMTMADKKGPLTTAVYRAALARNRRLTRELGIDLVMTRHRLDALVAPTGAPAWLTDLVLGDSSLASSDAPSTVTSVAGYPHITVPAGLFRGLPVGISFFGRAWSEPTLIKLAYAYEQATRHRRPPAFPPSADISAR
ncbi:MAG: amidase [Acidobacteria bacterium]|nr:MAG: amidase [Acidobacteriota bacterium]